MTRKELARAIKIARKREKQKIPVDVVLLYKFADFFSEDFKITIATMNEAVALIRWLFSTKFKIVCSKRILAYLKFKEIAINKIKIAE